MGECKDLSKPYKLSCSIHCGTSGIKAPCQQYFTKLEAICCGWLHSETLDNDILLGLDSFKRSSSRSGNDPVTASSDTMSRNSEISGSPLTTSCPSSCSSTASLLIRAHRCDDQVDGISVSSIECLSEWEQYVNEAERMFNVFDAFADRNLTRINDTWKKSRRRCTSIYGQN